MAAIGDAKTCPHGHPIVLERPRAGLAARRLRGRRRRSSILRFENEAEELLHYLRDAGLEPGLEGTVESSDDDEVVIASADGSHTVSRSVAETVSVRRRPGPAAARRAARAAACSRATATAADRSPAAGAGTGRAPASPAQTRRGAPAVVGLAADLAQAQVEVLVRGGCARRPRPPACGLVVADGGGERVEAPLHVASVTSSR